MNKIYLALLISIFFIGCKKDWLEIKANKSDVVPQTLADYQALLNSETIVNNSFFYEGVIGADNFYLLDNNYFTLSPRERNTYIWDKELYPDGNSPAWNGAFTKVMHANVVLEGLEKIAKTASNTIAWNELAGTALFVRSMQFYDLLQVYAAPYNNANLNMPGIPIRITADISVASKRATIKECYQKIITDLGEAENLLPEFVSIYVRPSKQSARALLARIYLSMQDYVNAEIYADKLLKVNSDLLDFNTLSQSANAPFPTIAQKNPEVIFHAALGSAQSISVNFLCNVDTMLYRQYLTNDLRKFIFYRFVPTPVPRALIKGGYTGNSQLFAGLANNEMFFIRAECRARRNDLHGALNDVNTVLAKRFITNTYVDFNSTDQTAVLDFILSERRKEFPFTGQLRWEDIRRLNQDKRYAKELKRVIAGITYTLPPNHIRYVYPLPTDEVRIYGLQQNPR